MPAGRQRAFTLTELTVVLLIVGLGAAIAVPAMRGAIARAHLRSAADALADALAQTRSTALRRQETTAVCPSRDGQRCTPGAAWRDGWIHHQGPVVLAVSEPLPASLASHHSGGRSDIRFSEAGTTSDNLTLTLCVRKRPGSAISLAVNTAGRITRHPARADDAAACAADRNTAR